MGRLKIMNSKEEIIRIINNQLEILNLTIIISKENHNTINIENLYIIMIKAREEIQSLGRGNKLTPVRTSKMKALQGLEQYKSSSNKLSLVQRTINIE